MGVIGVYDFDYFTYENVIPNLECAKLVTYYRNHNNITVLTPILNPERFTRFITRKEYDDGVYPKEIFLPHCEYGGRAFTNGTYKPLPPKIEKTVPDMHIYDKYIKDFGATQHGQEQIKRILNCAHIRLAPDGQNLAPFESFAPYFEDKPTGIFLHDYDITTLNAYDLIKQLQDQRHFITRKGINPYPIGNKYPIRVYSPKELEKWIQIVTIPNAFFLEYYGLMTDEVLYHLCLENIRMARQVYYNVSYGCSSENEFLVERAPKIFLQTLFLRKARIKILLTYDENFLVTPELKNFIRLLNCWLSFKWQEGFLPNKQSLFNFVSSNARLHYTSWAFQNVTVTIEECRNLFQFFRERNYECFKLFYEMDSVKYKGGRFIDVWDRN